ncbi:reverse transcriptase domain-containing protein [Zooshikella sp. RANM57]|uniref:reverse transcriptase domain-containing protein n=1 Tax=Zooshikella sp. RANM57 TaxID=3425863 RepID=UPI003D6FBF6D
MTLIEQIAHDDTLNEAYAWVCHSRKKSHPNNSVWHLRFHWDHIKPRIQQQLRQGKYTFSPCKACKIDCHSIGVWQAEDALVQKAMSLVLAKALQPYLSKQCYHPKGHGGVKQAVMKVALNCGCYVHVVKSDVKSYYASIKHDLLIKQLQCFINDGMVLDLIKQFLHHLDDVNGELFLTEQGISKGSSLSPLLGAIALSDLDNRLSAFAEKHQLLYIRFMDDWVVLTRTKRQLRKAVRLMNQVLNTLHMEKAPDKTFIGRIAKQFDFLGYRLGPSAGLGVLLAKNTLINHRDKCLRLYEQAAPVEVVEAYVKRWWIWVRSGVVLRDGLAVGVGCLG